MRIAYLDCFSGISGDMFLGAAVDAGVPVEKLQAIARNLGLETDVLSHRVERGGIAATKVDVIIQGRPDEPLDKDEPHDHEHQHQHGHDHDHEHPHTHDHEHHSKPHIHRGLKEIRSIIAHADISPVAKAFAVRAFELLAEAEGKIHNKHPELIHFHEVGSEDAIIDIVCSAVAIEALAVDRWYCSSLNVGGGTVKCAHGVLPVPAPATIELLQGAPIFSSGIQKELLTPTGAAILRALDVHYEPLPPMAITATGYGAGGRDIPSTSNVVRLLVGESSALSPRAGSGSQSAHISGTSADTVSVLEANVDDMNPQLFSYVQQKLLTAGALDAFGVPVQMKKGRPGILITVLASPADAERLTRILLTETTTLGVRMRTEQRSILEREHVTVHSAWGPIRVKLGRLAGEVVNCAPEFEDCRTIAETAGVPLKTVLQEAMRLYLASEADSAQAPTGKAPSGDISKSILS